MRSPFREVDEEVQYLPPHPAYSAVGNRELSGELQDIMSRLNTYGTDLERVEFIMEDCGLGKVPHGVQSVGSLLLFNSNINPYKDYQTLDNLISAGRYEVFFISYCSFYYNIILSCLMLTTFRNLYVLFFFIYSPCFFTELLRIFVFYNTKVFLKYN